MVHENLDEKLVNALLGDGRASLRSLTEELDASVTTISNHLSDLQDDGVIEGYTPKIDYDKVGYDVTAVIQLKAEGQALPEITESLREHRQLISVYEVTGDHDIIAIGKFKDTDEMNEQIKSVLTDPDITASNTSVVLNAVTESRQFELEIPDEE